MENIEDRLLYLIDIKGLTKSAFADKIGVSQPVITHITTGRNKPGLDVVQKILLSYPDISPDWLILGTGPVYRDFTAQKLATLLTNLLDKVDESRTALDNVLSASIDSLAEIGIKYLSTKNEINAQNDNELSE